MRRRNPAYEITTVDAAGNNEKHLFVVGNIGSISMSSALRTATFDVVPDAVDYDVRKVHRKEVQSRVDEIRRVGLCSSGSWIPDADGELIAHEKVSIFVYPNAETTRQWAAANGLHLS